MIDIPLYNTRKIKDLRDMLEQSSRLFGNKDAFYTRNKAGMYQGITYSDFKNDVDALGTALAGMGLKGGYIAVIGENRYEWCVTYLSTVNGTGVVVPLDKELPAVEIENLLQRSNAAAVVFSGRYGDDMKKIQASTTTIKYFINMDLDEDEGCFLSYARLVDSGRELLASGDRSFLDTEIASDEQAVLLFTSGTTDLAKGVMISHKNICFDITAVCSMILIDSKDSVLSILPLHHAYECTCGFLLMIYNGCTISFAEGLKHIPRNLRETRPTILLLVPLILESMYRRVWEQAGKKPGLKLMLKAAIAVSNFTYSILKIDLRKKLFKKVHDNLGGRIRLVISGAAAIDPVVCKGFRAMGVPAIQGYGLTECSPIVTVNTEFIFKDNSIGFPLTGTEVKIDSPGSDGIGEIIVKGDNVMLGYYNNEEATRKILKNGWLFTGDLGYMDNSGFVYITGRMKNVIVTKNGKNIYPEEVESYLNRSPYILESMVWGDYDEVSGETQVHAQIVPDFEAINSRLKIDTGSKEEIRKLINSEVRNVNKNMPLYKHIRQVSIREEEFAKTTTRKIKRYEVK